MIFFVWVSAVIVSLAPQFGWKDPEYMERIQQQKCMVSQDIGYQVCKTNTIHKENRIAKHRGRLIIVEQKKYTAQYDTQLRDGLYLYSGQGILYHYL